MEFKNPRKQSARSLGSGLATWKRAQPAPPHPCTPVIPVPLGALASPRGRPPWRERWGKRLQDHFP